MLSSKNSGKKFRRGWRFGTGSNQIQQGSGKGLKTEKIPKKLVQNLVKFINQGSKENLRKFSAN
jgi:hypothetical protein